MRRAKPPQIVRLEPPVLSLAGGVADGQPPGTLYLQAASGGYRALLASRFTLLFGRNEPDVHVCVGADDQSVSREHGSVRSSGEGWTLRNHGRLPLVLPGSRHLLTGHEHDLDAGYTPLFIRTASRRAHLVEAFVTPWAHGASSGTPRHGEPTEHGPLRLDPTERRLLVVLGQHYLRSDAHPQPRSWNQVAEELNDLEGGTAWTASRAAHVVERIRRRAVAAGIAGITRDEVPGADNTIKHNLITALLASGSLVPPDLRMIGEAIDW